MEWINLALYKENWRAVTNTATHLTRNPLQFIQVLTASNESALIITSILFFYHVMFIKYYSNRSLRDPHD